MSNYIRQFDVQGSRMYKVSERADGIWECSCPSWIHQKGTRKDCKHILQIKLDEAKSQLEPYPTRTEMVRQLCQWLNLPRTGSFDSWTLEEITDSYRTQKAAREITLVGEEREEAAVRNHFRGRVNARRSSEGALSRRIYENFMTQQHALGVSRQTAEHNWREAERITRELMEFYRWQETMVMDTSPEDIAEYVWWMREGRRRGEGPIWATRQARDTIDMKNELAAFRNMERVRLVNLNGNDLQEQVTAMRVTQREQELARAARTAQNFSRPQFQRGTRPGLFSNAMDSEWNSVSDALGLRRGPRPEPAPEPEKPRDINPGRRIRKRDE